jgi:DNA-binding CsgD family transcriptional regulator/PAS domain-containing protein
VAALVAEAISADGAMILVREGDDLTPLCALGSLTVDDRPPAAPFMLGNVSAAPEGKAEWREGPDSTWLIVRHRIEEDAEIVYGASFRSKPAPVEPMVAMLVPALKAYACAFDLQRQTARQLASYQSALNRSELGIVLIGRDGAILFENSAAGRFLDSGDVLRRRSDGLTARDLGDALKLEVAIEHVRSRDSDQVEDPVVALKRRHPLRPLLVCVSPAGDQSNPCDASAILRIIDPDREVQPLLEPVCSHYRLSPVETRLACLLARGLTIEAAAETLRIKPQTARSYLKQIFLKTDTNRQSELVRMLLTSTVRALPAGRFRLV